MSKDIFEDLFVLELANNHWGRLDRGLRIIEEHARIVRFNNVRAAIKLQIRDVPTFVHKDFVGRDDIRYVKKTLATQISKDDLRAMARAIRENGCIPMATPFDERSVDTCMDLGIQMLKIASSDTADWFLIEKMAQTRKPLIVSTGGAPNKDLADLVRFCENRGIPLAINHCVSIYPCEDSELELNQIDYLRSRFPNHVIGLSTHEYHDWHTSIAIAYAKGARTFERHIDIEADGVPVSPYCSLPHQVDQWFKAYRKVREMCGGSGSQQRIAPKKEVDYLHALVRGVYASRDLPIGHSLREGDVYLAIALQKGQVSCREFMRGEVLLSPCAKDQPVMIDMIDCAYARDKELKQVIYSRGV